MISVRKARRELDRVRLQFGRLHWFLSGAVQRRIYDLRRSHAVHVTEGEQSMRKEAAIMLLFQPAGVAGSTFFTLSWLGRQGVSCIVVSNVALSCDDRQRLSGLCHLVIERPNFGYDFGGYREGILTLFERGVLPRPLYLLNDSVWFPLREDCDAIAQARASEADLFGLFLNQSARKGGTDYLQSYFFRFGRGLVASNEFRSYWATMRLINDKLAVVRNFERRLTEHFRNRGYSVGYIHSRQDLVDALLALDDDDLRDVVAYLIEIDSDDAERLTPLLARDVPFALIRPEIEGLIRQRRIHHAFAYAHPAIQSRLDVSFMKKARISEARIQRLCLMRLGLDVDFAPDVAREIRQRDG